MTHPKHYIIDILSKDAKGQRRKQKHNSDLRVYVQRKHPAVFAMIMDAQHAIPLSTLGSP